MTPPATLVRFDDRTAVVTIAPDGSSAEIVVSQPGCPPARANLKAAEGVRYTAADVDLLARKIDEAYALISDLRLRSGETYEQTYRRIDVGPLTVFAHKDTSPPRWRWPLLLCAYKQRRLTVGAGWNYTAVSLTICGRQVAKIGAR